MFGLMWRLTTLSIKAGLVVAGIAVVVAYARLSEFGDLRKAMMQRFQQTLAGRLSIDGPVELTLSFPPSLSISDVRIRNSSWGTRPDMLKAGKVVAEVDLLPLVRGQTAVPRIRLLNVDLVVEKKKDGKTNWDELASFTTDAGGVAEGGVVPGIGDTSLMLSNGTLTIIDQAMKLTTTVQLPASSVGFATGSGSSGGFASILCP